MSDLLTDVLAAHGGAERWHEVTGLVVTTSLGGPFWAAKGWPDVLRGQTVTVDTRAFDLAFASYPSPGHTARLRAEPERLEIRDADGALVDARDRPRTHFPPTGAPSQWDAIEVAYFAGCGCWNYFTAPFLFAYPGVAAREIEPWGEDGQTWRRLAVTFPAQLPNHSPDQVFYYDDDLLLRRMDYQPEVTGAPIAHYTDAHRTFDGFVFPTERRVHLRHPDGTANREVTPITIHVDDVQVRR